MIVQLSIASPVSPSVRPVQRPAKANSSWPGISVSSLALIIVKATFESFAQCGSSPHRPGGAL
jgi:hypothetical protein